MNLYATDWCDSAVGGALGPEEPWPVVQDSFDVIRADFPSMSWPLRAEIYPEINETRQSALPEESASWGIHGRGTLREEGGQGNLVALHCKCATDERQDADTVSRFGVEYCNRCGLEVASP